MDKYTIISIQEIGQFDRFQSALLVKVNPVQIVNFGFRDMGQYVTHECDETIWLIFRNSHITNKLDQLKNYARACESNVFLELDLTRWFDSRQINVEENGKKIIKSNAKIIELSDGSYQLVIGDQFIDIVFSNMDNVRYAIDAGNNINIVGKNITKRMLLSKDQFQGINKMKDEDEIFASWCLRAAKEDFESSTPKFIKTSGKIINSTDLDMIIKEKQSKLLNT